MGHRAKSKSQARRIASKKVRRGFKRITESAAFRDSIRACKRLYGAGLSK